MKSISLIRLLLITAITLLASPLKANCQQPEGNQPYDNYRLYLLYQKSDEIRVVKDKLDALMQELQTDAQYDAWILSYGGKRACAKEAKQRAEAAKGYLVNKGIGSDRIVTVDAGFHEEWGVELWLVIHDTPGPAARPSIKREAVQFVDRKKKQRNKCLNLNRL